MQTFYQSSGINFEDLFIPRVAFSEGGLWVWGYNTTGSLGDGTVVPKSSPVQTVAGGIIWKQIDQKTLFSCAIKTDGTLWLWGYNPEGELGDNTRTWRSSPVQTVAGGTNWKQVSGGAKHTGAIKADGTLWMWGGNSSGQLGLNNTDNSSSPVQTVAYGSIWKLVSCGAYFTSAIKTDGTLWNWGNNSYGSLGDGTTTNRSSPVQTVSGGTNWKLVSSGSYHTAAIKTDGTLWLCGSNSYPGGSVLAGQLGDGTTTDRSSPVQTVAGGTNWKLVLCGDYHTAAIKTDGTLWSWGLNSDGQLGDGTVVSKSSPVQTVSGGTNWKSLGTGFYNGAAIKTDGTLWTWGLNNYGQLGDGTTDSKSSPVQTLAGGTNWKQVVNSGTVLAIQDNDPY